MEHSRILKQSKTKKLWQHFLGIMLHGVLEHRDFIISVLGRHDLFYTSPFVLLHQRAVSQSLNGAALTNTFLPLLQSLPIHYKLELCFGGPHVYKKRLFYIESPVFEGKNSKFMCYSVYLQEVNCFCGSFPHLMNHCCLSPHRYPREKG